VRAERVTDRLPAGALLAMHPPLMSGYILVAGVRRRDPHADRQRRL
jgi:hypothetical protein